MRCLLSTLAFSKCTSTFRGVARGCAQVRIFLAPHTSQLFTSPHPSRISPHPSRTVPHPTRRNSPWDALDCVRLLFLSPDNLTPHISSLCCHCAPPAPPDLPLRIYRLTLTQPYHDLTIRHLPTTSPAHCHPTTNSSSSHQRLILPLPATLPLQGILRLVDRAHSPCVTFGHEQISGSLPTAGPSPCPLTTRRWCDSCVLHGDIMCLCQQLDVTGHPRDSAVLQAGQCPQTYIVDGHAEQCASLL